MKKKEIVPNSLTEEKISVTKKRVMEYTNKVYEIEH